MTLAEILATYPAGSDERLNALSGWRRAEDARLAQNPPLVKVPTGKRLGRPPAVPAVIVDTNLPVPVGDEARREWERRRDEAERVKIANEATALRARLNRAVSLTVARINVLPDMSTRREKEARLAEIQVSLASHTNPKTLAIISQSFSDIEARLARLSAE
jgi:hypothetical protein